MSRWKHRTETVTVGANSQTVRALTAGQRAEFAAASNKIKAGELDASELPFLVIRFGATTPELSAEEIRDMPTDLTDACVTKILELTGFKDAPEKKIDIAPASESSPIPSDSTAG